MINTQIFEKNAIYKIFYESHQQVFIKIKKWGNIDNQREASILYTQIIFQIAIVRFFDKKINNKELLKFITKLISSLSKKSIISFKNDNCAFFLEVSKQFKKISDISMISPNLINLPLLKNSIPLEIDYNKLPEQFDILINLIDDCYSKISNLTVEIPLGQQDNIDSIDTIFIKPSLSKKERTIAEHGKKLTLPNKI